MAQLKLPNGALGLIVSSTNEAQQEDLFFPCEPRLFAVNVAGDPECGSLVFDLNKANEPDSARGAYLQSAFRVVKLPLGQPNAIAFQLDLTGQRDTQGGFFCEIMQAPAAQPAAPDGGTKGPGVTVVQGAQPPPPDKGGFGFGEGSHNFGGPFHVGVADDKHRHGEDADGNPINALHIWTEGNFFKNRIADGPIRFELEYKEGDERDFIVPVHLAWSGADWALWTSTDFYVPRPYKIVPQQPIRPLDREFPNFDFAPFQPLPELPSTEIFNTPINTVAGEVIDGRVVGSGVAPNLVATLSALMAPAMVFRPENYNTATESTGLFDFGEGRGSGEAIKNSAKADSSSPITAMASAFGAQGGFVDAGGSGSGTTHGGEGDPWVYTQIPRGAKEVGRTTSKYPGGTASGGIIYHPPETDLRDIDSGMVPDNVTLSETRIMCAPGASFGVGIPNLETGGIKTGANWAYDSDTGDMVIHTYSFTTESEAIRLTNPTQLIRWMSGQSFYGEFSHTNTANRTWTFPDVTSTISSILFDTVAPTAVATEGTFGWDTAANNLYVNNDGATGWTFVGGASSVTGSGANTRVAFWTSATALSSDAGLTYNSTTDVLTVTGGVTVSALTAGRVLFAGTAGAISDDAGLAYNSSQDRLTITGTSNARLTLQTTHNTTTEAIEISQAGTGDATITMTAGGESWTFGYDQSVTRFAIANTTVLGTGADMLRLTTDGAWSYSGQAVSTGAADEFTHHDFNLAGGTITFTTDVTLDTQRAVRFRKPTYAATAATQTITNAATVYIENAPTAGTNVAITNPYALWVDDGVVRFDGNVGIGTTGPDAKLDILSTTTQLRLTYTDGSVYSDVYVDSFGILYLAPTAKATVQSQSYSGDAVLWRLDNTSNTASSGALFMVTVAGGSGGDAYARFDVTGLQNWVFGVDNDDGDKFKIDSGTALGGNNYFVITTAGSVGIGTSGPDRKLDILDTNVQLRLTYTDGTVYSDLQTDSAGTLVIRNTANNTVFAGAAVGSNVLFDVQNSDNTNSASHARIRTIVGGASAGDPFIHLLVNGVNEWSLGLDNSDSDKFKISNSSGLGTSDYLSIATTGETTIHQWLNVGLATQATAQGAFATGTASNRFYFSPSNSQTILTGTANATETVYTTSSSADAKYWDWTYSANQLDARTVNDAYSGANSWLTVTRSGYVPTYVVFPNGNVGIGTTGPDRKLDILDASNPQLRLTHTDGSIYQEFRSSSTSFLWTLASGSDVATAWDMDFPSQTTTSVSVRYFRSNAQTTGTPYVQIFKGDGTATIIHQFAGQGDSSFVSNDTARRFGIGTSTPTSGVKCEILSATLVQQRLSYTLGSQWRDFAVDSASGLKITGPGTADESFEIETTRTITGAVTDGYAGSLILDPGYSAATAQTVTRHNYIDVQDVSVAGAGPAAVTDACLFRFDAALGTHKATTNADKTGNAKDGTIKVNVNGVIKHIQLYAN